VRVCYEKAGFCNFSQVHLLELEKESQAYSSPRALYVLYPDDLGATWRVQAVPVSFESFENRKSLPESWRGLRDAELTAACGVPGCVFVHLSGFTGGELFLSGFVYWDTLLIKFTVVQATRRRKGRWRWLYWHWKCDRTPAVPLCMITLSFVFESNWR
jgi:hypothetical protein